MPKRIINVLKIMGVGLETANTKGAMNTTEQKKRIMLGKKNQSSGKAHTPKK